MMKPERAKRLPSRQAGRDLIVIGNESQHYSFEIILLWERKKLLAAEHKPELNESEHVSGAT